MTDDTIKILVAFPVELKEEVEEYQHEKRLSSRTAAIIELIEKGLKVESPE